MLIAASVYVKVTLVTGRCRNKRKMIKKTSYFIYIYIKPPNIYIFVIFSFPQGKKAYMESTGTI